MIRIEHILPNGNVAIDRFDDATAANVEQDGRRTWLQVLRDRNGRIVASFDADRVLQITEHTEREAE